MEGVAHAPGGRTDVESQFRLGRLKNFRDRIVHEALRPPIHIQLLDFPSALYWDALLDILGLAAQRVAGQVLAAHHIEERFPGLGPQRVVGQPHASPRALRYTGRVGMAHASRSAAGRVSQGHSFRRTLRSFRLVRRPPQEPHSGANT